MNKLDFEENRPFYEMINSFFMAYCGLILYHPFMRRPLTELHTIQKGKVAGMFSFEYGETRIDPLENADRIDRQVINLGKVTYNLLYMLVNISYESVKDRLDKSNPLHEYFRHVRNAASHGGYWSFKGKEPIKPASWRGRLLDHSFNGKPLFDTNNKIAEGDIIALLWDVEQTL